MINPPFTKREAEILARLIALPYQTQMEIARNLGITERTMRSHVSNMEQKGYVDLRHMIIEQMHLQAERKGLTMLSRSGNRRLAVVLREAVKPINANEAIEALRSAGDVVFVLTLDVDDVLAGLEGDPSGI